MNAPITLSGSIARNAYVLSGQVFTGEMVFNYLVNVLGYSEEDAVDELKNGTEWALGTMSEGQRKECYNFAQIVHCEWCEKDCKRNEVKRLSDGVLLCSDCQF